MLPWNWLTKRRKIKIYHSKHVGEGSMLKDKILEGKTVLGTWCEIPSPTVVNVIAKAGLDFVIIDMEHGPIDFQTSQEMAMAAESERCESIIRVPMNDESYIQRALDTGTSGIIVPHIENIEDRKKVVKYSKFAPIGSRGFNPYIRAGAYNSGNLSFCDEQNKQTIVGIILEGTNGLNNVEDIISDASIDLVYIGAYDLSVALGVPGDVANEKVVTALIKTVSKIRALGKCAGCMVHNVDELIWAKEHGFNFITYKVDSAIIYDSFSAMRKEIER